MFLILLFYLFRFWFHLTLQILQFIIISDIVFILVCWLYATWIIVWFNFYYSILLITLICFENLLITATVFSSIFQALSIWFHKLVLAYHTCDIFLHNFSMILQTFSNSHLIVSIIILFCSSYEYAYGYL